MKIDSKVFAEFNNTPTSLKNKPVSYYSEYNNTAYNAFKNPNIPKQTASFGQDPNISPDSPPKSNPWSLKNITNVLGVVLGVGIVGGIALKMHFAPKEIKESKKVAEIIRKTKVNIEKLDYDPLKNSNWIEKVGIKANNLKEKLGDELLNNIIYGIGTVIVMPLVILFSPLGKKDSSKEDKMFAVLRQPLSFITMFSIQLTADKVVKDLMKKVTDKNLLEENHLKDKDGKLIKKEFIIPKDQETEKKYLLKHPEQVQFNNKDLKEHFENMFELNDDFKIKNGKEKIPLLNKEDIKKIFLFEDPQMMTDQLTEIFKEKKLQELINNKQVAKNIETETKNILSACINAKNKNKTLGTCATIVSNVIVSQAIGCTLLNVIYGKSMKQYQNYKQLKTNCSQNGQTQSVKGGDQ